MIWTSSSEKIMNIIVTGTMRSVVYLLAKVKKVFVWPLSLYSFEKAGRRDITTALVNNKRKATKLMEALKFPIAVSEEKIDKIMFCSWEDKPKRIADR